MSKKEDIEKKKKEDEEKLNKLLEEFKQQNDIDNNDIEKLESILHTALIDVKYSKKSKFFLLIKPAIVKFILFYFISILCFGFFFSFLALTTKYYIFAICGVISFILTMFEMIPYFGKIKHAFLYLIVFGLVIMDICLLNNFIPIFTHSYLWIFFIISEEVLYALIINVLIRIRVIC